MFDLVTHTISQGLQAVLPIAFCLPWFRRTGNRDAVAGVKWGLIAAVPLTAAGAYWFRISTRQALWEAALASVAFVLALWFARSATRGIPVVPWTRRAALARLAVAMGAGTLVARQTMEIAIVWQAALALRAFDPLLALAIGVTLSAAASAAWLIAARRLSTAALQRATIVFAALFVAEAALYAFHESAEARLLPWSDVLHAATEPYGPDGVYGRYASVLLLVIPAAAAILTGRSAHSAAIARLRRIGAVARPAAATAIVLTVVSLSLMGSVSGDRLRPETALDASAAVEMAAAPHLLFRSMATDSTYSRLSVAPLDQRDAVDRPASALTCERVSYAAGRGICLDVRRAVFPTYKLVLFDRTFTATRTMPLDGRPSRTRISRDGRVGAITVFVTGHAYTAAFATKTTILDMETGDALGDLEQFGTWRNGARFKAADFNFWGVTFAADSNVFYATLRTASTGQPTTFLVRGDLALRKLTVLRENVECPSLSPDNHTIAFKKRLGTGNDPWRLYLLDTATLTDRPLEMEKRSIDDQVEWLDDGHVLYAAPRTNEPASSDVWVAPIDNSAAPRVFLAHAESPIVVR